MMIQLSLSMENIMDTTSGHHTPTNLNLEEKYIPSTHVDLGQGLLQIISDMDNPKI